MQVCFCSTTVLHGGCNAIMDGNKRDVLLLIGSILIVLIACMGTISADDSDNYDGIIPIGWGI